MKPIALLLALFTAATAHAGSFGGPPPFTNGSPLESGVDGAYQASARGNNLSGIITFSYNNGVQTLVATANRWAIFSQGQVFTGATDAAINDGKISGVLETSPVAPVARTSTTSSFVSWVSTAPATTSSSSRTEGTTLAPLANPSGYFNAKLDNNSPTGSFKGNGVLAGIFTKTVTSTGIDVSGVNTQTTGPNTTVTTEQINAPFKVKGVRAHTGS